MVIQAIEASLRALRDEDTGRLLVRRSDVDTMTEEQIARAQATLASLEKRVAELRRLMGEWREQFRHRDCHRSFHAAAAFIPPIGRMVPQFEGGRSYFPCDKSAATTSPHV